MFQWTVPGSPVFEELQHLLLQPVVMQRKTGHRAGLPESHRCWEHSPSSSTCCSHTSGRGATVLKHWNMTHFLISTSCRLFGVQIIYFQLGLGKKKKKHTQHPAFYLFTLHFVPQLMEYKWPVTGLLAKIILNFSYAMDEYWNIGLSIRHFLIGIHGDLQLEIPFFPLPYWKLVLCSDLRLFIPNNFI